MLVFFHKTRTAIYGSVLLLAFGFAMSGGSVTIMVLDPSWKALGMTLLSLALLASVLTFGLKRIRVEEGQLTVSNVFKTTELTLDQAKIFVTTQPGGDQAQYCLQIYGGEGNSVEFGLYTLRSRAEHHQRRLAEFLGIEAK